MQIMPNPIDYGRQERLIENDKSCYEEETDRKRDS